MVKKVPVERTVASLLHPDSSEVLWKEGELPSFQSNSACSETVEENKKQTQRGWKKKTFLRSPEETMSFITTQQACWTENGPGEKQ